MNGANAEVGKCLFVATLHQVHVKIQFGGLLFCQLFGPVLNPIMESLNATLTA